MDERIPIFLLDSHEKFEPIAVESVEVSQDEGAFSVSVSYVALQSQERNAATFTGSTT